MATPVILPKLGMTMDEATILRWMKHEGEAVRKEEPLLEIMTDKVEMEVESPAAGILRGIRVQPGTVVPVAAVIAYILAPGEELPADPSPAAPLVATAPVAPSRLPASISSPTPVRRDAVAATPAARRLAREKGIALSSVTGTGPGGSITEADVRAASDGAPPRESGG